MKISTLSKFLCTLSIGVLLLLGMSIQAQAQRRHYPTPYGQRVSARMHNRNELRRALIRHQRVERGTYNASRRNQREIYSNSRDWRVQQRQQRTDLRMHQRDERAQLKERWKNNRKQR
jgi:hypothetical protein